MTSPFDLIQRGWYIFPIKANSKTPLVKWSTESSNDPEQVKSWSIRFPGCNWGINCGKSGLFVVDIDRKGADGLAEWTRLCAANGYAVPTDIMRVATPSGGYHLYFTLDNGPTTASILAPGIDTRGRGGMVVAPGSTINGVEYKLLRDGQPAPAPAWVIPAKREVERKESPVDLILDMPHNVARAIRYLQEEAPEAHVGERDNVCFRVACRVRDFGLSRAQAEEIILEHYADKIDLTDDFDLDAVAAKVESAYRSAQNPIGCDTPEALFPRESISGFTCAASLNAGRIRPREWVIHGRYMRRALTVTISPGGIGKSTLTILEGMAVATGKVDCGHAVKVHGPIMLINLEDPKDELDRRVMACAMHHGLALADLKDFHFASGEDYPLILARDSKDGVVVNEPVVNHIIADVKALGAVLLIIDPFVALHGVNENDNMAIEAVAAVLRRIARETGAAVSIVHHARKGKAVDQRGELDTGRGASALGAAARICHTLYTMSAKEAKDFGRTPDQARWLLRLDSAKGNYSAPQASCVWFRRVSHRLWDDHDETVGVLEAVTLDMVEKLSLDGLRGNQARLVELIQLHPGSDFEEVVERAVEAKLYARKSKVRDAIGVLVEKGVVALNGQTLVAGV